MISRYNALGALTAPYVGAEPHGLSAFAVWRGQGEGEGPPRMPEPDFIGIDAVPMGEFIGLQEEVDRSAGRAALAG